jgi:DNA-binding FadR family transcriptional regulator
MALVAGASGSAVEGLEDYIIRQGCRPGDKLPSEREFAERLGLSRTAVREAVKRLNQKGLIRSSVGRGLFVAERSTEAVAASLGTVLLLEGGTFGDVMELRRVLGTAAARFAAERATPEDVAALRGALEAMEREVEQRGGYGRTGSAFHLLLARIAHNPLLAALAEPVMALMDRCRGQVSWRPTRRGLGDHRRIYQAVASRDPASAAAAMDEHVTYFEKRLTAHLPNWRHLPVPAALEE